MVKIFQYSSVIIIIYVFQYILVNYRDIKDSQKKLLTFLFQEKKNVYVNDTLTLDDFKKLLYYKNIKSRIFVLILLK